MLVSARQTSNVNNLCISPISPYSHVRPTPLFPISLSHILISISFIPTFCIYLNMLRTSERTQIFSGNVPFWRQKKSSCFFSLKDLFQICVMSICSIPPKTCSLLTPFSRLNHLEDEIRDMINNRRQEQKQARQPIQRK